MPKLVRECVRASSEGSDNRKWVIFDGPVDAVWIENMNTVLDDNKTLCLANSERIKLPSTLHMMFEVQDLRVASPATVSRCGMVFMEQIHVGCLSLVRSWGLQILSGMLPDQCAAILELLEAHLEPGIEFVQEHCKEKIPASGMMLTQSLLNLLEALLDPSRGLDVGHAQLDTLLKHLFVWAFVWTIGATIDDKSRPAFQQWFSGRFGGLVGDAGAAFLDEPYNLVVNPESAAFVRWEELMDTFKFDLAEPYFSMLVPTVDTTRYTYLLNKLVRSGFNVLYAAETGVGKSSIMQKFLDSMSATNDYVSFSMVYSAQTKPLNVKDILEVRNGVACKDWLP